MAHIGRKKICMIHLLGLVIVALFFFASCGDDGESVSDDGSGTVMIYNYDNHDYEVQLRSAVDDTILGSVNEDDHDFIGDDWTDSFVDVPEGTYYLVILRDGVEVNRTHNFTIDEDDTDCYLIDDDGRFDTC